MAEFKQELLQIIKDNKRCNDCGAVNPGWTSLTHAVLVCLACAGTHRSLGVHISFVRSMTMDDFTLPQMQKMRLGGNAAFTSFMQAYPQEGGYREGLSIADKYSCWAAQQYREKLTALVEGKEWSPSSPPAVTAETPALRKSRTATRSNTRRDSPTPTASASISSAAAASASAGTGEAKTVSEKYFASLGEINASRRDDLPPNQGGKYTGFGNSPGVTSTSTPQGAPSLSDLQSDPVSALSRGWSIFSNAVVGASRAAADNVMDPGFQDSVRGYVSEAGRRAGELGKNANVLVKDKLGVDVADQVGGVIGSVRQAVSGTPGGGYEAVAVQEDEHESRLYADDGDGGFDHKTGGYSSGTSRSGGSGSGNKKDAWKDDDWGKDGWKDDGWN